MRKHLLTTVLSVFAIMATAQSLPYQNASLSAGERADDLLGRLTLEEKVNLMMDTSPAIERLGIPQFQWWNEALHGIGRNGFATVFPITMGMAASWDDALLHRVFTAVSDEARVKARQAKTSNATRVSRSGHRTSISSVTPAGDVDRRLMVKTPTSLRRWDWQWYEDFRAWVITEKTWASVSIVNCWLVPNTLPYTAAPSGTVMNSMWRICLNVISGKPICLPSKHWYRRER